ncbi:MAG: hypothetical protein ABI474_00955 [Actinomycetota bacterium]
MNAESVDVTAGLEGFLAFFLLAVALYFLMRNMNSRMRRMAYREEQGTTMPDDGMDDPDGPDGPDDDAPDSSGPKGTPDLG